MSARYVTGVLHLFCLCQTDVMFWLCLLDEPLELLLLSHFYRNEADVVNRMASLVKVK